MRVRAGLDPLASATEQDVEKERIKEYNFEAGDRMTYLTAMKRDFEPNGRVEFENPPEMVDMTQWWVLQYQHLPTPTTTSTLRCNRVRQTTLTNYYF